MNSKSENEFKKRNLKGRVKSLKEFSYNGHVKSEEIIKEKLREGICLFFDRHENNIKATYYKSDMSVQAIFDYDYDSNGNLTEMRHSDYMGMLKSKEVFAYDRQGNKVKEVRYDSNGKTISNEAYSYDLKGNKVEEINYNLNGEMARKFTYLYDDNENLKEIIENKLDGEFIVIWRCSYKYDNHNNIIEELSFQNELPSESHKCKYELNGNVFKESIYYDESGRVSWSQECITDKNGRYIKDANNSTYEYDDKGNLIEVHNPANMACEENETYFTYKFDDKGNWVNRLCSSSIIVIDRSDYNYGQKNYLSGNHVEITERVIEYFDNSILEWINIFRSK